MKQIIEKCKVFLEKRPILYAAIRSFLITFAIAAVGIAVLFFILRVTEVYAILESALDLKYNSPYILVPLWSFVALFVLCVMAGVLMYFHKYKRANSKSAFYKRMEAALGDKKEKVGKR